MDSKNPRFGSGNDEKELSLPFGYKFDPTGVELIEFYLIPKLKGQKLPSDNVMDFDDVCQYEPRQLPFNQFKHAKENEAFFFTLDSKKNSVEETQIRTTLNGYWKVYQDNVAVEVIGFKTKLFFHDIHGNKTDWKMIEYRCHPSRVPTTTINMKSHIVCKIKLRMKKEEECLVEQISEDEIGINGSNSRPKNI